MSISRSSSPLYLGMGVMAATVFMNVVGIDADGSLSITCPTAVVIPLHIWN